jgi:Uma2 family endonuclease
MLTWMGKSARRPATYEDLMAVPDTLVAEILDGELVTHPRPAAPHARSASRLGMILGGPFDLGQGGPGGWLILYEPELHLRSDVVVPDLAAWRRERMPEMPHTAAFELAPDWACEVLSPSTASVDRTVKMDIYAREQVAHLWLVHPVDRTVEAYGLEAGRWIVAGTWRDDARARIEPFGAIELDLATLWER